MPKELQLLQATPGGCCTPITEEPLAAGDATELSRRFKALGDPVRLRLLSRIASAEDEICVCDLTGGDFEVSAPTISHHLKVLREAGLITGERRGTWVYYRPVRGELDRLSALLGGQWSA
ncbi:transcriptional regulator [Actinorhabdospora filicis]|uniref:Transcriptional regulator n=1 Tax=Actinorhabdospora filicis TaxID=1785913 RepID=A0A9W6SJZ8_9ACTN|nr:metalloregulator ArsR/SmtB family transcription factor [Actinorhabdospora filicis]GLZ78430.1 transcriptional regulator [Actinorhabdospora filicis]